ncbi:MAG: carboxylesterase family protein [Lachnospiraceae bacterium]|nr:carboxylesterase family protein [Lachnospiraceae bacterium]
MKKTENRKKGVAFYIVFSIILLLMLAVLELNKNTVMGFILTLIMGGRVICDHLFFLRRKHILLRLLIWPVWIGVFALILFVTWPPVRPVPAVTHKNPVKTEIVSVQNGDVQGVLSKDGKIEIFTGIPYAKPPVGELRWTEPQDPDDWEGVLLCDHFAPMSMQPTNLPIYDSLAQIIGYHDYRISLKDNYIAPVSEDSLYLNIWRPAGKASGLPVVVYVHGGSLKTGQPWYSDYSGEGLAREGVIVVNMGYRLGAFGFFADEELANESSHKTTGNYGLLDQIKALTWVRDKITAVGGDPDTVTLAGESAGSASVSALCVSPLAAGLFKRAVLESSTVAPVAPTHSFRSFAEALKSGKKLKERYGCETVNDLRQISAKKIVGEAETQHHITVDGYVLTKTPYESYLLGEHNEQALLHGYNRDEAAAFLIFDNASMKDYEERMRSYFGEYADKALALYPASTNEEARKNWSEVWGAIFFDYAHYCLNRLEVGNNVPVYQYWFTKDNGRLGPWHSGEEVYLYGNIPDGSRLYDEADRNLSRTMLSFFVNFAKTGDPNGEGLPEWQQNLFSEDVMEFGENTGMIKEKKHELFMLLDKMQGFDGNAGVRNEAPEGDR